MIRDHSSPTDEIAAIAQARFSALLATGLGTTQERQRLDELLREVSVTSLLGPSLEPPAAEL